MRTVATKAAFAPCVVVRVALASVTARSADAEAGAGPGTVVCALAALSAGFPSGSWPVTVAVSASGPATFAATTTSNDRVAPLSSVPTTHWITSLETRHAAGSETMRAPDGTGMLTTTPVSASGPLLPAVTVNEVAWPIAGGVAGPTTLTEASALFAVSAGGAGLGSGGAGGAGTAAVACAVSFAGTGSGSFCVTVATTGRPPAFCGVKVSGSVVGPLVGVSVPIAQTTSAPCSEQPGGPEVKVAPGGSGMRTVTPVAVLGPFSATVTTNVAGLPIASGSLGAVTPTALSAATLGVTVAVAVDSGTVLPLSVEPITVVLVSGPVADASTWVGSCSGGNGVPGGSGVVGVKVQDACEDPTCVAEQSQPVPLGSAATVTPAGSAVVIVTGADSAPPLGAVCPWSV